MDYKNNNLWYEEGGAGGAIGVRGIGGRGSGSFLLVQKDYCHK